MICLARPRLHFDCWHRGEARLLDGDCVLKKESLALGSYGGQAGNPEAVCLECPVGKVY